MIQSRSSRPWWPFLLLLIAYLVRNDFWWWRDATLVAGLPIGLLYHFTFCLVACGVFYLLVRFAWPEIDEDEAAS